VFEIRQFKPTDMFSVIKLASETLTEHYNPSIFNYFYETFPKGFIVAEYAYKIIGFLIGVKVNERLAKILMISISELYQNKNLGSELLKNFLKIISGENVKIVELEVRVDNKKALKFYEKHGFKIKNEIKDFYQNGESAYTMGKEI
jgi:ribosomal-protein-alanine N-acetyltransferase